LGACVQDKGMASTYLNAERGGGGGALDDPQAIVSLIWACEL
jgi:hypothetical protein